MRTVYFHIDVNSAFLSWTAVHKLQHGEKLDIRTVPAVIGGKEKTRHGIILANSIHNSNSDDQIRSFIFPHF